jgi:cyclophilin family peptidyl-prolyl cis-trans isomerase
MDKQNLPIIIIIILLILGITFFIVNKNSITEKPNESSSPLTTIGDSAPVESSLNSLAEAERQKQLNQANNVQNSPQENKMQASGKNYNSPPAMSIDKNKTYTAEMKTTEGTMKLELDVKNTPITSNNFIFLAKDGFYDNTIFHRVIKDFMIQGGDPLGTGAGGPGYNFNDEPVVGEYVRGTLAMANAGPNTNGSQFFIMHNNKSLPKDYVIFGKVIEGLEILDKIATSQVTTSLTGEPSKPVNPVKILSVDISEK